ncbi:hypothetical protein PMAYCL1PPCAC_13791, partial [Pristionchus mayeri]
RVADLMKELDEERRRTSDRNRINIILSGFCMSQRRRMREAEQLVERATSTLLMHCGLRVRREEEGGMDEGDIEE